ncbi:hypothetical protein Tco_1245941, partial [Tanacetum coccineum]
METKDTLSSCSYSDEQDMQQMLKRAKILKGSCLNGLSALKLNFTRKLEQGITKSEFERAFSYIFGEDVDTFTRTFSQNMDTLEQQLTKETILESNCQNAFRVLKTQFEKIFTSTLIKPSCLDGTLDDKKLQIQECTVQEVKASNACSGDTNSSGIVSDKGNDQSLENQSNTSGDESNRSRNECNDKSNSGDDTEISPSYDTEPMVEVPYTAEYNVFVVDTQHYEQSKSIINTCVVETGDSNVIPDSPDMCDNDIQNDQNAIKCEDERVALANLIANLKLDIDENKKIQ